MSERDTFERLLDERYRAEFSGVRLWPGHKDWWMRDQGPDREKRILEFLRALDSRVRWRGKVCLDVGCGSGAALVALHWLGARSVGLDSELVGRDLPLARARARMHGIAPALVEGDALALPFRSGSVDAVISTSVAEHICDVERHFREAHRVLVSGGTLVLLADNRLFPKEFHTGLWLAHWLPYALFRRMANQKRHVPKSARLELYPRTLMRYKRLARRCGFDCVAGRWDVLLEKPDAAVNPWKRRVAALCRRTRLPLEAMLPDTVIVLGKVR